MSVLRRYAGPGIVFVIGVALQFGGWQSRRIAWLLILVAVIWAIVAVWPRLLKRSKRRQKSQRMTLELVEPHEDVTVRPNATHAVRVRVVNHGETADFVAQVAEVTGTAKELATPW